MPSTAYWYVRKSLETPVNGGLLSTRGFVNGAPAPQ
jgi:hypothetical protein